MAGRVLAKADSSCQDDVIARVTVVVAEDGRAGGSGGGGELRAGA